MPHLNLRKQMILTPKKYVHDNRQQNANYNARNKRKKESTGLSFNTNVTGQLAEPAKEVGEYMQYHTYQKKA